MSSGLALPAVGDATSIEAAAAGFRILPRAVPRAVIDRALHFLWGDFVANGLPEAATGGAAGLDRWSVTPTLADHPLVWAMLAPCVHDDLTLAASSWRRPQLAFRLPAMGGAPPRPHRDGDAIGERYEGVIGVALAGWDAGGLRVWPGSHLWSQAEADESADDLGPRAARAPSQLLRLRRGDAIVMDPRLVHAAARADPYEPRIGVYFRATRRVDSIRRARVRTSRASADVATT